MKPWVRIDEAAAPDGTSLVLQSRDGEFLLLAGGRPLMASDQHGLVQDYAELIGQVDVDQSVPVADRLLGRYGPGSIASISFDKGFTRAADRELLRLYIPEVVMPKRGRKSATEAAAESTKTFVALRRHPYFFCGAKIFSPFLNTAKIACDGQASRQRRQLSRQREGSNL